MHENSAPPPGSLAPCYGYADWPGPHLFLSRHLSSVLKLWALEWKSQISGSKLFSPSSLTERYHACHKTMPCPKIEVILKEKGKYFRICRPSGLFCWSPDGYFWRFNMNYIHEMPSHIFLRWYVVKKCKIKKLNLSNAGWHFCLAHRLFSFWLKDTGHFLS